MSPPKLPFSISNTLLLLCFAFFSCQTEKGWIDKDRILNATKEPQNWLTLGGNYEMQHFSTLKKINKQNVMDLGLAWEYDASSRRGSVHRGLEAAPSAMEVLL